MSNLQSLHTFIICAYGDSPFLETCIQSLQEQTISSSIQLYTSTPSKHIQQLCEQYAIPMHSSVGGSIGKDWNNALSFTSTPYVTIAHQDDIYQSSYAEEMLTSFQSNPENLIVFSDYMECKNGQTISRNTNLTVKRILLKGLSLFPQSKTWRHFILSFGNSICCPAVTYNMDKLRGFQFNEQMRTNLDWYAWYQINQYNGVFSYIPKPLMYHRIHQESETSQTIADNTRTKEDLMMFELFWPKPLARLINSFYIKGQDSNH
ncbi:glycosyltransferase family 2 protein [Streptococcus suis]|nr:glycosyltransferase family 2 protein [Streptococcus suis]